MVFKLERKVLEPGGVAAQGQFVGVECDSGLALQKMEQRILELIHSKAPA